MTRQQSGSPARPGRPRRLLALTVGIGGGLSAILVNDIVVFAMTPLLCHGLSQRKMDPRPFLLGLAAASNAGSAATLIGNPQNIMIGQVGGLGFWPYFMDAAVPAIGAMLMTYLCISLIWSGALREAASPSQLRPPSYDKRQAKVCFAAIIVLLVLYSSSTPREISTLLVAAALIVSRTLPTRRLLDDVDVPLLILFASLFVINDAFARTGISDLAIAGLEFMDWLPNNVTNLAPLSLVLSNTIGNVPAVVMILEAWHDIPPGTLTGLAILSTLAGNLFLVGSLANLIVAERAQAMGVAIGFADHAKAGIPITVLSMAIAGGWLSASGLMPL